MSELKVHGQPPAATDEIATLGANPSVEIAERFPVTDPGVEEEPPRYTDSNDAAGNRVYHRIVTLFAMVPVMAIAFVVVYFAVPRDLTIDFLLNANAQHVLLGLTLGLAILFIGIGAESWARNLMSDIEHTEQRHPIASSEETREKAVEVVQAGIDDSNITRRKLIGASLLGAIGILVVPALVTLADLGPWPTKSMRAKTIERTIWAEGVRLVNDVTYAPIKPEDLEIGQLVNAEPATLEALEGTEFITEKAKAAIIIVRMAPAAIQIPAGREDWQVGGILSYSKICTHVGCPISLWEQQTHHLLCPCHQSTFDLANAGKVLFGPAARSLPQLPITVDSEGYLIARSDFTRPVGPSYFERNSPEYYDERENI